MAAAQASPMGIPLTWVMAFLPSQTVVGPAAPIRPDPQQAAPPVLPSSYRKETGNLVRRLCPRTGASARLACCPWTAGWSKRDRGLATLAALAVFDRGFAEPWRM